VLERRFRLVRSDDFKRVRHVGKHWRNEYLILNAARSEQSQSRFGFVVSKQVGGAVVRNRLKRRLRSAVRNHLPGIAPGYDMVIVARPSAGTATYRQITESLDDLLKHSHLLIAGS
jgi:ribonuclease P protein component